MHQTENINVIATMPLPTPRQLHAAQPLSDAAADTVVRGRDEIKRILRNEDDRLLLIVGPCSIHDTTAAMDYAKRLQRLREEFAERLCIIMRVYFEKPRTTIGWKGLIYDPFLDGTDRIDEGLRIARSLLLQINELGMPCASEFLDPVIPQYIADLISWAAIGARTTESQTHRELCSGLSMPVGFKNGTEGNLQIAVDAMVSARHPHTFLGVDMDGLTALVRTKGNPFSHIVLRGGRDRPNYDEVSMDETLETLRKANQPPRIMVDCSHANSNKKHTLQPRVFQSVLGQRVRGNEAIFGMMVESNLMPGSQKMPTNLSALTYGVSITDECIGWDATEELIRDAARELSHANCGMEHA